MPGLNAAGPHPADAPMGGGPLSGSSRPADALMAERNRTGPGESSTYASDLPANGSAVGSNKVIRHTAKFLLHF